MGKTKNAFTLIELLAVIVILAIIALIATPIILGIVEDAKKDAFLRSVELLVSTTDIDIANKTFEEEYTYEITDGTISNLEVSMKNTAGMNGSIKYDMNGKEVYAIHNGVYCVKKTASMSKAEISDYDGTCSFSNSTDVSCFSYDYLNYDIEINKTKCIEYYTNQGHTEAFATKYCNNESFTFLEYINLLTDEQREDIYAYELLAENNLIELNENDEYEITDVNACSEYMDEEGYEVEIYCENDIYKEPFLNSYEECTKEYSIRCGINSLISEGIISRNFNDDTFITLTGYGSFCPKDVVIPNSIDGYPVKEIADTVLESYRCTGVFACSGITSVVFPEGLTKIGPNAFEGGYAGNFISELNFPDSLTYIGENAFSGNKLSGELDLSNTQITSIRYGAFEGESDGSTNQITSVKFPNSLTTIEVGAFGNNAFNDELDLSAYTNLNSISGFDNNEITSIKLPSSIERIDYNAFKDNKLSGELDLSDLTNLISIGEYAFAGNEDGMETTNQIVSIKLPDSIEYINDSAFRDNKLSGELDLSDLTNLISIGSYAFAGSDMDVTNQITSVKLSNSLTYIDNYAFASNDIASVTFYGRSNLDDVTLGIDAFGYFDESNITFENY